MFDGIVPAASIQTARLDQTRASCSQSFCCCPSAMLLLSLPPQLPHPLFHCLLAAVHTDAVACLKERRFILLPATEEHSIACSCQLN